MSTVIAFAKLPFCIDVLAAREEVELQLSKEKPHFNTAHYTGEWTAIALRSAGGKAETIIPDAFSEDVYSDTEVMQHCPEIKRFVQSLGCEVMSVRLLNLKKGAIIKEHRDADLSFEKGEARLHVPLVTNSMVEFFVDGNRVTMQEGECWYINANLPHRVSNPGETDRIHLVIDCKVNDWLQKTFEDAEKTYSKEAAETDQLSMIIKELRLQNTVTSNKLADQLQAQLNIKPAIEKDLFPSWLPYEVVREDNNILLRWLYVNDQPFTEPFFDESILKCKRLRENSSRFKSVSDLSILTEWSSRVDSVEPTAFIFHVSRCGSTLVSQLLGMKQENISLSEVPVFDAILQMPLKRQADETTTNETLRSSIKLYGAKRTGNERRLFIKADSWHLLFYHRLRNLYPSTPFIILYRHPAEVLFSQRRKKGMHAVYGLVEPAVFNFDDADLNRFSGEDYMALVLEKYFRMIVEIAEKDRNLLLLNYLQGIESIMQQIAGFVDMPIEDCDRELFSQRSKYHSKDKDQLFCERDISEPVTSPNIETLASLYEQIEELRRGI